MHFAQKTLFFFAFNWSLFLREHGHPTPSSGAQVTCFIVVKCRIAKKLSKWWITFPIIHNYSITKQRPRFAVPCIPEDGKGEALFLYSSPGCSFDKSLLTYSYTYYLQCLVLKLGAYKPRKKKSLLVRVQRSRPWAKQRNLGRVWTMRRKTIYDIKSGLMSTFFQSRCSQPN